MGKYEGLIKRLRNCISDTVEDCAGCPYQGGYKGTYCMNDLVTDAADALEELSSQLEDFKRLCLPLKENRFYKFDDGSFTEVTLMIVPREPTEPPKEEA